MYEDIYKKLSDSMVYSFSPLIELKSKLDFSDLDSITETLQKSCSNLTTYCNQKITIDFAEHLSALANSLVSTVEIPSISLPDLRFLKEINFQEKYIELTESECDSVNILLKSSNAANDESVKVSKGKLSMTDFIKTVLIPILAFFAPMLLTIYYHKIDSIESQKLRIEELQLKEEELRIEEQQLQNDIAQTEVLKNILIQIQNFPEYLESLQAAPECPSEVPVILDKAPEPFGEDPNYSAEVPGSPAEAPEQSQNVSAE